MRICIRIRGPRRRAAAPESKRPRTEDYAAQSTTRSRGTKRPASHAPIETTLHPPFPQNLAGIKPHRAIHLASLHGRRLAFNVHLGPTPLLTVLAPSPAKCCSTQVKEAEEGQCILEWNFSQKTATPTVHIHRRQRRWDGTVIVGVDSTRRGPEGLEEVLA
ncbi:hypothetical protein CVT26_009429 [Gymnopilus dilepis]|uniref:Uncharacterized protein n=1 Tax=Gymnopilus dilepis TaxID=231916 RepID=A0A409WUJ0_9AGAR|nr:hypothetical protein CVT26_009429 [Gymnopilus dilepis]